MSSHLKQVEARVKELSKLSTEVIQIGSLMAQGKFLEASGLKQKAEKWYRGGRALLMRENFSGLPEFDWLYRSGYWDDPQKQTGFHLDYSCISAFISHPSLDQMHYQTNFPYFAQKIAAGDAFIHACISEVKSRELSILGELSFVVSADEFETASNFLRSSQEETITRASGVIARVALERHLRTVAHDHNVTIVKSSPNKTHPDFTDISLSLKNAGVITEMQRARLDVFYRIGNNCAHPKEVVNLNDVEELIRDGPRRNGKCADNFEIRLW